MPAQGSEGRFTGLKRLLSSHKPRPRSKSDLVSPNQDSHEAEMGNLKDGAKLAAVTELMNKLSDDLEHVSLLPQQRDSILEEVKLYGREPQDADPIFTNKGIEILTRHAFNSPSTTTSRHALRCLCNAMLLKEETRQIFVDLDYGMKVGLKIRGDSREDEFLVSRILFLTTYGTNIDMVELIDKHHVADSIVRNLERHAKLRSSPDAEMDEMDDMALTETAKLLFNITYHWKQRTSSFTAAIPHLVTLLCRGKLRGSKPLDPPLGSIVNVLLNLELAAKEVQAFLFPPTEPTLLADRLTDLLQQSSKAYSGEQLELVTALVGVIRAVHEYGPDEVKTSIRTSLLPTDADRAEVLGKGDSLSSWLLRSSTNPLAPSLRETVSDLLFDMADKDTAKFVDKVGYGFASAFLFSRNMPIPQNATEAFANADPSGSAGRPINPVTGQFLDRERHPDVPEMSAEEKEREAERLFVLFERVRANGVISVENPVRTAQQSGRFEELADDAEEEEEED